MKIDELNQQAMANYLASVRNEKQAEQNDSHSEVAAKQQPAADKVELSAYIPVAPRRREPEETKPDRVEELKAKIASGTYEVSSTAVAEKMLKNAVRAAVG